MEWLLLGVAGAMLAAWGWASWPRDKPSPEIRELEVSLVETILASMKYRPEEWTVFPFRVVNTMRGVSVWRRSKSDLSYGEGLNILPAEGTPVPAELRDEMWDAIVTLNTRQIMRRLRNDGR